MSESFFNLDKYKSVLDHVHLSRDSGKVTDVSGMLIRGTLPGATIGAVATVSPVDTERKFTVEVVGFQEQSVLMMPLSDMRGVSMGCKIELAKQTATVRVGPEIIGRVLDGMGQPMDQLGELETTVEIPLYSEPRNPLRRKPIDTHLDLGVRAINGLLSVGRGQRIGIMAGSGVGKSVLLGMMAKAAVADVNVIALIGERGREVREFIERDLGEEGLKKSIVVCVTSDQSPLLRMRGAFLATSIAEYFAGMGKDVLLMMDSVTRFAMAQREIGLSAGEPPATKGYTPSVFSILPRLLERAGSFEGQGSITGLYTVLVDGDDMNEPIADAVRSIVDGHIVLSRKLAHRAHFPSIDILQSVSRVMTSVITKEHQAAATRFRENLAIYQDAEDLINIGAYKAGANPKIDRAVRLIDGMNAYLTQGAEESSKFDIDIQELSELLG